VRSYSLTTAAYPNQALYRRIRSRHKLVISRLAYGSNLQLIPTMYYLQHSPECSYGMKRCIGSVPPRIALRCLVSACHGNSMVNKSATIWSVGKYLNLIVPCCTWSLESVTSVRCVWSSRLPRHSGSTRWRFGCPPKWWLFR
jgi:hypothetical protein